MSVTLTDQQEGLERFRGLIRDREHWIVISASPLARALIEKLEPLYLHKPDDDFLMAGIPGAVPCVPAVLLYALNKKWMTPAQLATCTNGCVPKGHDIVLAIDTPREVVIWFRDTFRGCFKHEGGRSDG
jgi:hypothetical protein